MKLKQTVLALMIPALLMAKVPMGTKPDLQEKVRHELVMLPFLSIFDDLKFEVDANGNPKFNPNLPHSTFYKTPILFQNPRSIQVGLKFTL